MVKYYGFILLLVTFFVSRGMEKNNDVIVQQECHNNLLSCCYDQQSVEAENVKKFFANQKIQKKDSKKVSKNNFLFDPGLSLGNNLGFLYLLFNELCNQL